MSQQNNSQNKKKSPFELRHLPMDIGRIICTPCTLAFRMKRVGLDGKKYDKRLRGGNLIVANHERFSDPFVVGTCFWYRRTFCLAAEVVMKNPLVAFLLKGMGCIRIDRTISDIEAIKKSVSLLKEGHVLVMFPQGGIDRSGEMDKVKGGSIIIAMQAGVPIVPMYTRKRKHWYNRQLAVIGEPLVCSEICKKKFPSITDIETLSAELLKRMEECREVYDRIEGGESNDNI